MPYYYLRNIAAAGDMQIFNYYANDNGDIN